MSTVLHPAHLHTLAQAAGLSSRFPDGHVALHWALQETGHLTRLHRYSLLLENAATSDVSYGFAVEVDDTVWGLGDLHGWDAIEESEKRWGTEMFEEWGGGPATKVEFHKEVVTQLPDSSPYIVNKKTELVAALRALEQP